MIGREGKDFFESSRPLNSRSFPIQHESPARQVTMLTAYVDESGQEGQEEVIISGYLGNDKAWERIVPMWKDAIKPRNTLHMKKVRWASPRAKGLLERIGPIPDLCGLTRILGGVRVSDYADLFHPMLVERLVAGYAVALFPLVIGVLNWIPKDEKLHIVFEQQTTFAERREEILRVISHQTQFKMPDGTSRLAAWSSKPKETLLEPADALAYTALQKMRDPSSERYKVCSPMMGDGTVVGGFMPKDFVRDMFQFINLMIQHGVKPDIMDRF